MINEQKRKNATKDDWETPQDFFDKLNAVFDFGIDLAASAENAKCSWYTTDFFAFDKRLLKQYPRMWCWCNPPYSRQEGGIEVWVREVEERCTNAVMLIPASVGSQYWHDSVWTLADYVCLLRGRINFSESKQSPMFDSALVIFGQLNKEQTSLLSEMGVLIPRRSVACIHADECMHFRGEK